MDTRSPQETRLKAVTIKDIAARCGFSMQTVSRAILRDPRISKATTEHILVIAAEMGYDPSRNLAARRMALSQHGRDVSHRSIAFFTHISPTNYMTTLLWSIWEALAAEGYICILVHSHNPVTKERLPLPSIFKRGDVDGTLMLEIEFWAEQMMREMMDEPNYGRRPIISLMRPLPGTLAILPDFRGGACAAVAHLFTLGHRHLLHFHPANDPGGYTGALRVLGYADACQAHGLDPDHHLLPVINKPLIEADPALGISELLATLRAHPEITAILARNDPEALKIVRALRAAGKRVPEEISVIGFDDTDPLMSAEGDNTLTTVQIPLAEIARLAVTQLLKRIGGEAVGDEEQLIVPVQLMPRKTTAACTR